MVATFRQIAILPGCTLSTQTQTRLQTLSNQELLHLPTEPDTAAEPAAAAEPAGPRRDAVEAMLCGWSDHVTAALLDTMPRLRYLGLRGTSTHHIDLRHAARRRIKVQPIYRYGDIGTAEFVMAALLDWVRGTRHQAGQPPHELAGKTLGLVGYGNVARRVARAAGALGMRVSFFTPRPRPARHARWRPATTMLAGSDAVSLHTPAHRIVLTGDQLHTIPPATLVIVTTLGLPFPADVFTAWQRERPGPVVFDRCALHQAPASIRQLPGVTAADQFAARTSESITRAEQTLLANLRRAAARR